MGTIVNSMKAMIKGRVTLEQFHRAFNWKVNKEKVYFQNDSDGKFDEIKNRFATVRVNPDGSRMPLGVVKSRYTVIQNEPILDAIAEILGIGAGEPYDYHLTDDGARFAFRLLFPKYLCPNVADKNDFLQLCLSVRGSHDGSSGNTYEVNPIRYYCLNGALTLGGAHAIQIVRHTANADLRLGNIRNILQDAEAEFELVGAQFNRLSLKEISVAQRRDFVKKVLAVTEPDEAKLSSRQLNIINAVEALAVNGRGNNGKTLWDAYNGFTEYVDHQKGSNVDARNWSAVAGSGAELKRAALRVAMELVEAR